ncbi:hypothetical protein [Mangrovimonas aestuarii]|nr:hypothetical protein [Mangrovimonas aestuarii]
MAKLYSQDPKQLNNGLTPKKETVKFLLDYSKALHTVDSGGLKFDTILN